MTAAAVTRAPSFRAVSDTALKGAAAVWLGAVLLGQWAFVVYLMGIYGLSAVTGDFHIWDRLAVLRGKSPYVLGDTAGNLTYLAHALAAGFIAGAGALQLMPQVRRRWPGFHRWTGRTFLATVVALSLSGFYLVWVRHGSPDRLNALSTTANGGLILGFAALALRSALSRDLASHRRWAMRLYLVSNAQWFLRIGVFGWFVLNQLVGRKAGMSDPFLIFWVPGCYLVPLAVLELYLRARDGGSPTGRFAVAGLLGALTLLMGVGIVGFSAFSFLIVSGAPLALPK
jgi:uncharacterized membrane protein